MKLYFYNMCFYTHDGDSCVLVEQSRQLQKLLCSFIPVALSWQVCLGREGAKGFVFCGAFLRHR